MCKVDETSRDTKQGQEKIISETNKSGPYFGVGRKTFWPAFFWEYALALSKTSIFAFFQNSYTRVNRIYTRVNGNCMRACRIYTRAISDSTRADRNDTRACRIYTRAVSGSTRADRNGIRANGIYTRAVSVSMRADRNGICANGIYTRAVSVSTRADRNGICANWIYTRAVSGSARADRNCIRALGFEFFGRYTSWDGVYLRPALRSPCFLDQIQPIRQNRPIKPPPFHNHTYFEEN